VPVIFLKKRKRPAFFSLFPYLEKRFALLLYGLRRVGKTTIFYQLVDHLLDLKIDPKTILYFSFDEKIVQLETLFSIYQEKVLKKNLTKEKKIYCFFDEIQKLSDWQSKIKIIYDLHPNIKLFLSGSASVFLQKDSRESLAGRMVDFFVKPLSFREFLDWKNIRVDMNNPQLYQAKVAPLLMDYLRKGGFPEIVEEESDELIRSYLKNTILERILYRDLPEAFGLKDIELLKILVEMIASDPGMILNIDRIARDFGRTKVTVSNYLDYLSYALLVREVRNIRSRFLVSSRKAKKIYPTSSAFSFSYRTDFFQEEVLQKMAETAVSDKISAQYYYRDNFEVDFVAKKDKVLIPVEVKYGKVTTEQIEKFMARFKVKKGIIVSKNSLVKKRKLEVIPLWQFLLQDKISS